jgi:hypothetical protein
MSCFQFSNARAARTCRPVIIHDHLRQTTCAHQKYDYNSRLNRIQRPADAEGANFHGRFVEPERRVAVVGIVSPSLSMAPCFRKRGNP